jgi:acetolactate synthase-1/2/3 large subunit
MPSRSAERRRPRAADALAATLAANGVRHLFTLSGNQIMSVFDALLEGPLGLVHVRHEAAAVHMADAWGRLTGEPGVALLTAGPGFANGLSALYSAFCAESPLVLLSGAAPIAEEGLGAFQEMPQARLASPFAKASWTVERPEEVASAVARALRLARSGRPGPVQVTLPVDVLEGEVDSASGLVVHPTARSPDPGLARLAEPLAAAERPLLLLGPWTGRPPLLESLRTAAREALLPLAVLDSPRGLADPRLGLLPELLAEADLLLLVGKRLDFALRFGRSPPLGRATPLVVVDPEREPLERARRTLGGRLLAGLEASPAQAAALLARAVPDPGRRAEREAWCLRVAEALRWRPAEWSMRRGPRHGPCHPLDVARALQPLLARDPRSVLLLDGGEFGQWARATLDAPRLLGNGPSGAIGGILPMAVAARLVEPEAPVVALMGDGTVGFHLAELDTAVRHHLPFLALVGNDARWNAEQQIQRRLYGADRVIGCDLLPTRYDRVAEGLGALGMRIERPEELAPALEAARASGRPALLDVRIEPAAAPVLRRGEPAGAPIGTQG